MMIPIHVLVSQLDGPHDDSGAFLLCASCLDVHRVSKFDRAPAYEPDGTAQSADDFQSFLLRHAEHPVRLLRRSSDVEVHSHARHDPMRRVSWEVVDEDGAAYVIVSGREDVESPRRYSVRPGRLVPTEESIGVDAELLRSVIDEALYPHVAPESRLRRLTEACQREVSMRPWDRFDPIDEDREDPNTQLACLPDPVIEALEFEARSIFPGIEGDRLAALFGTELRHEIPIVRLRRKYVHQFA